MTHLDTSFLFKLYVVELDSATAIAKFGLLSGPAAISNLSDVEMATSFYRKLPVAQAQRCYANYRADESQGVLQRVDLSAAVYQLAGSLAGQYAATFKLRSLDTLQLATALHYGATALGTYDDRLKRAAQAAGLAIL